MNQQRLQDHIEKLSRLTPEQRTRWFIAIVEHLNYVSSLVSSQLNLPPWHHLQAQKAIGQCIHWAAGRVHVQHLDTSKMSDDDFIALVHWADEVLHRKLRGSMIEALDVSFEIVEK